LIKMIFVNLKYIYIQQLKLESKISNVAED
jgi:hypothetical protein